MTKSIQRSCFRILVYSIFLRGPFLKNRYYLKVTTAFVVPNFSMDLVEILSIHGYSVDILVLQEHVRVYRNIKKLKQVTGA